jgi:hypothetical protein
VFSVLQVSPSVDPQPARVRTAATARKRTRFIEGLIGYAPWKYGARNLSGFPSNFRRPKPVFGLLGSGLGTYRVRPMRLLRRGLIAICASTLLAGCPSKPQPPAPTDGGVAEAPHEDAGTPTPPPASFTLRYQLKDGGMDPIALAVDEQPTIESTSVLELRSSVGLRNYRIRLFDEAERAMVSDDSAEETPNGVIYRISLPTPLKSGHKYTLVLDAQTGSTFTDSLGRELQDLRLEFQIAGEKEKEAPAPPPKKPGKKKRR